MRILVVDDSERLRTAVMQGLKNAGHVCDSAADGQTALGLLYTCPFDVMVLDIVMPRLDGLGVLREVRKQHWPVKVLVLSARDQVVDRVAALDLGADDYLVKPFSFDELRARVDALGRRAAQPQTDTLHSNGVTLDPVTRIARCHDTALALTPKEYHLLEALLRRRGQVISRTQLFDLIYDTHSEASDRVIEVLMSKLRTKLEQAGCGNCIQTRRGFGYVVE